MLIRPTLYSIFLTFKCQFIAVFLARPLAVAGRIPWNRVCPSSLPECFLRIGSLDFSGFCQGASNHYDVVHGNPIFLNNLFCPKNWGNGPKKGFLNLKENLVINFHWICSIMNVFIICCVPAQNLCLGKILFLRCRPKYSQSIKLHNFEMNYFFIANWVYLSLLYLKN